MDLQNENYDPIAFIGWLVRDVYHVKTDAQLAQRLEVAPSHISKIRSRKMRVPSSMLVVIHEDTGLHVRDLRARMWKVQINGVRVYISGPMSGLPDFNRPAFNAEAARLRALGYDVVNPAELNPDPSATWVHCMRVDIRELTTCAAISLLPGWEQSRGAKLEWQIAEALGLKVIPAAQIEYAEAA